MQTAISLNEEVLRKAEQALTLTRLKSLEELFTFLIEEKLTELLVKKKDPIFQVRGILKGKPGGTELFLQDKHAEIDREYNS